MICKNNFFILLFFISNSIYCYKTFENDTKCEKFGAMLLNNILNKEPFLDEYKDAFKLLIYSGTGLNDLGNYNGCKKLKFSDYYIVTILVKIYPQTIGICYYKDCNINILKLSLSKIINFMNNNTNFNLFKSKDITIINVKNELEINRKKHFFQLIVLLTIYFIFIVVLPILQKTFPKNQFFSFFNIKQNFIEMFSTKKIINKTNEKLKIIYGIKSIYSIWIVFGQIFQLSGYYTKNMSDMFFISKKWYFNYLSGCFFSVDMYVFFCGFLFYFNLNKKSNNNNKNNRNNLLINIFQRYFRIFPIIVFYTFFGKIITPFLSSGPNYQMMKELVGGCDKNYWHNLFMINNLIKYNKMKYEQCITNLCYISCIFHYFFISLLVIYFLYHYTTLRKIFFFFLYFCSVSLQIYTSLYYKFKYNDINHPSINDSMYTFYFFCVPYCKITPFFIGILFGNLFIHNDFYLKDYKNGNLYNKNYNMKNSYLYKFNNLIKNSKYLTFILTLISLILINISFWTSNITNNHNLSLLNNALLLTFAKDFYVFGVAILLHLLYLEKFKIISKFLKFKIFEIYVNGSLGIMAFANYTICFIFYEYNSILYQNIPDFIILGLGNFIISYLLGIIILPIFEMPFLKINKKLFDIEKFNQIESDNKYIEILNIEE